ncbi:MAG: pimeloyl-ACP methyl ester esterase BioH [Casimicrobiaceae bacterium]
MHVEAVGAGRPLVLLHGYAMHGGLFAPILPELAARRRVHVPDLPGHGHSAPLSPLSLDAIVAALDDALADVASPLDVLGWSLGGAVAMRWAASRPQRIGRLVLVATTPSFVVRDGWPHAVRDETLARFGDELRVAYRLTLQRFLTLQTQGSEGGRATLAAMRHRLFERGEPTAEALEQSLALLRSVDLRAEVPSIRARTLVVAGARDALAPRAAQAWLAGALPNATFDEMAGAAHAPFLSHRERFVEAVSSFLDRDPPAVHAR